VLVETLNPAQSINQLPQNLARKFGVTFKKEKEK